MKAIEIIEDARPYYVRFKINPATYATILHICNHNDQQTNFEDEIAENKKNLDELNENVNNSNNENVNDGSNLNLGNSISQSTFVPSPSLIKNVCPTITTALGKSLDLRVNCFEPASPAAM